MEIDALLDWPQTPTSQQVRYAQENLWVCRALLSIVARVNELATGHHDANIKEIQVLSIGQQAATEFQTGMAPNRIFRPVLAAAVGPGGYPAPGSSPVPVTGGGAAYPPAASGVLGGPLAASPDGTPIDPARLLDQGRYVDAQGKPLDAGAAAGAAPSVEFKRMPVYLRLVIDQREVTRLLAECANSPLPVEVRQLRLNPPKNFSPGGGGGSPVYPGRPGGAYPAYPGRMPPGYGGGAAAARPAAVPQSVVSDTVELTPKVDDPDATLYDIPIELHGIIYIFNPPDRAKLGLDAPPGDKAAGDKAIDGEPAPDASAKTTNAADATDAADATGKAPAKAVGDDQEANDKPAAPEPAGGDAKPAKSATP
jgi:hypothetical protein